MKTCLFSVSATLTNTNINCTKSCLGTQKLQPTQYSGADEGNYIHRRQQKYHLTTIRCMHALHFKLMV